MRKSRALHNRRLSPESKSPASAWGYFKDILGGKAEGLLKDFLLLFTEGEKNTSVNI